MKEYETTRAHRFFLYKADIDYIFSIRAAQMNEDMVVNDGSEALRKIIREHRSWAEGLKRIAQDGNGETN